MRHALETPPNGDIRGSAHSPSGLALQWTLDTDENARAGNNDGRWRWRRRRRGTRWDEWMGWWAWAGSRHSWQTQTDPAARRLEGCRVAFPSSRASEPRDGPARLRSPAASPLSPRRHPPNASTLSPFGPGFKSAPPPKTCIRPNNVIGQLDVVAPQRYLVVNHAAPRHRRATESSSPFSDLESSPSPIARFLALSPLLPRPPTPLSARRRARDAVPNFV